MSSSPAHMVPHTKASLSIRGNLEAAKYDWSIDDMNFQHRLVVFHCVRIDNNTVIADFNFASAREAQMIKHDGHSHINCLYSRITQKWFFIGTDALTAVERMLGVELGESGRKGLRNKFDSYGPITARNSREDLSDIFSLIKNNERLKPRNVEKGVRIYRWEELTNFLQGMARHIDLRPMESSEFAEPSNEYPYVEATGWQLAHGLPSEMYHDNFLETNGGPNGGPSGHMGGVDLGYAVPLYNHQYGHVTVSPQYDMAVPLYVPLNNAPEMYNCINDPALLQQEQHQHQHHHHPW